MKSLYTSINAKVVEMRQITHNYGGSDVFENHDDDYIVSWIEYRIVHRNGVYNQAGEFTGECHELTEWSKTPVAEQMEQLDSSLYLIEIYTLPKLWVGKELPDYVAVVGKARELYAIAVPLRSGKILAGIVSTDGFWEAGKTYQGSVTLPLEKARTYIQPSREQSAEMQEIAFFKLNDGGQSYCWYKGEPIAVEPVEGKLGTYYKYPTFKNRYGVGSAIYIRWELDIDPRSAEKNLQSQLEELKYL